MLTEKDIIAIRERGSDPETVLKQLAYFRNGFPYLQIIKPATVGDGITRLTDNEIAEYGRYYDESVLPGDQPVKICTGIGSGQQDVSIAVRGKRQP